MGNNRKTFNGIFNNNKTSICHSFILFKIERWYNELHRQIWKFLNICVTILVFFLVSSS